MSIKLGEVLFPLRYDVWDQYPVVAELSRLHGNVLGMLEAGRNTAIHRHIVIADPVYQAIGLLKPLAGEELRRRMERYYGAHLEKLTSYYRSIKNRGWDRSQHKIYYKRLSNPTITSAGNLVPDGLFLSDGQHRTTALLALGYTELPDYMAATEPRNGADFLPLDMTWAYIKAGECTEQKFVEFARLRFPDIPEEIETAQWLADWMWENNGPEWVVEYIKLYWR